MWIIGKILVLEMVICQITGFKDCVNNVQIHITSGLGSDKAEPQRLGWFKGTIGFALPLLDSLPAIRVILGFLLVFFLPGFTWTLGIL